MKAVLVKCAVLGLLTLGLLTLNVSCVAQERGDLETVNGWTEVDRKLWYRSSQGSRLIPASWFFALEKKDDSTLFSDINYLSGQYGFIRPPAFISQDMPIGFTMDGQSDKHLTFSKLRWYEGQQEDESNSETWVGLNCSACHTNQIMIDGNTSVIDGAPGMIDFQSFVDDLDDSLRSTRADSEKWSRFSKAVLEDKFTPENIALLENSVDQFLEWQKLTADMNETPMRYGFARLDAVGHILNKILMFNGATATDGNESNAPVSIPFLWNIWRQQLVQWNGVAENSRLKTPGDPVEYGALGRNTGEMLGVFGDVNVDAATGVIEEFKGFKSSVRVENLGGLERILTRLEPPAWPASLPQPDRQMAAAGETIFNQKCASCHLPESEWKEDEPTERMITFEQTMTDNPKNLTDIWMACNAYINKGPTNRLAGRKDAAGQTLEEEESVVTMLEVTIKGALLGAKADIVKEGLRNFFGIDKPPVIDESRDFLDPRKEDREFCLDAEGVLILGYKARPLDGIWATAPYLHNGSIPTLYDLLLPQEDRPASFFVGNKSFDPIKVGFVSDKVAVASTEETESVPAFEFKTLHEDGVVIEGNSNAGHDYGVGELDESGRMQLLEYLKTL